MWGNVRDDIRDQLQTSQTTFGTNYKLHKHNKHLANNYCGTTSALSLLLAIANAAITRGDPS